MIGSFPRIIHYVVLSMVTTIVAHAQDVDEVLSRLQKKYASVRDLTASFAQTVRFGVTQTTQSFDGKIWIKKGNKYRIEMEQRTIVTDGASVWTYSDINRQVFVDVFRDDPKALTPDRILTDVPRNYFATLLDKEKVNGTESYVLKLTPKDTKSLVKSLKVWAHPSEWIMVKVEVLDVSDNLTTYVTHEVKVNSGLSDQMFRFDAPPGVEVIDLRPSSVASPDSP
jgi:chaperone LolA